MNITLKVKDSPADKDRLISCGTVRFEKPVRGLKFSFKGYGGNGTFDLLVDGTVAAVLVCRSTAPYHDLEESHAEIPLLSGTHEIAFQCPRGWYFDAFVFTEESPYQEPYLVPEYCFRETNNDLLTAVDMLGRKLPDAEEAGPPRKKFVGLFYWTWRHLSMHGNPRNLTQILKEAPEAEYDMKHPIWTDRDVVHWNEPFYGFYRNDDPYVIRKHAQYFANAGVDVLVFDATNGSWTWDDAFMPLLEELTNARKDGIPTPQVAFMMNFGPVPTTLSMLRGLYQNLYKPGLYRDLWFMWDGKPLVMAYPEVIPESGRCDQETALYQELREFFTFRPGQPMYAGGPTRNDQWGWLEIAPQNGYVKKEDGTYEMCTVGVAQNARDGRICTHFNDKGTYGRSYTFADKHSRLTDHSYQYGYNVQEQWEYALQIDPEYIFITGWNEWIMGKFPGLPWVIDPNSTQIAFVDQYDREHSRDIEPDIDGYLDTYYLQMAANIRRFKGLAHVERDTAAHTLKLGDFAAWEDIRPEYISHKGTAAHRDYPGLGNTHYQNQTGRNNLISAKAAYDAEHLYFLCTCAEKIEGAGTDDDTFMTLLLDTDKEKKTGWEGYDYKITEGSCFAYRDGAWVKVGDVPYVIEENLLALQIPRAMLGLAGAQKPSFEFKWSDHIVLDQVMNFYRDGDCAPFGRFNYLY